MANAVFNSLEEYFGGSKLRPNVDYAKFDLSHIRSQDMDLGILTPFYLEDCLPGDRVKISLITKLQALPLRVPLFNNVKLYTYFFYVPYYLLWRHFDRFIAGGRDGTYSAELPYIELTANATTDDILDTTSYGNWNNDIFGYRTLWDYLGFEPIEPYQEDQSTLRKYHIFKVSAFPFAAYQRIFRDFFLDQDVQTDTNVNKWFPEDDMDFVLHDGLNVYIGEGSDVPTPGSGYVQMYGSKFLSDVRDDYPLLMMLRTKNFNKDYFTSSWFSPQRGPAQAVPVSGTIPLDFSSVVADNSVDLTVGDVGNVVVGGTDSRILNKLAGSEDNLTSAYSVNLRKALEGGVVKSTTQLGFTISDLHLAKQIELWMERNMSVKAQYNEFLRIHFNDAPLDQRLTKPQYLGGSVQDILVSQVMQTSQTTDSSAQGTLTGNAHSVGSDFICNFHSHEYGLIMGIACIMPESYYEAGLDRHWTKSSRFDFYFPELSNLEAQAILKKEYSAFDIDTGTDSWLDKPLSYIGRFDEYRHHRSLAVGSLRDPNSTDFSSWVMARTQVRDWTSSSNPPVLGQYMIGSHKHISAFTSPSFWLDSDGTRLYDSLISHNVWDSGYTVNPFLVQFGLSVTAVRPMPYSSDPSKI